MSDLPFAPEVGEDRGMRLRFLVVLLAAALVAPAAASAQPAAARHASAAKVKPCKRKKGETKKHWLKRCKCKAFKGSESRKHFKKRCPGAKVPKRKPAATPAPPTTPPATGAPMPAPAGPSDIDKVTAALSGKSVQYGHYSSASGSSDFEEFRFCGATFTYSRKHTGVSGYEYNSSGNGVWQITQAHINPDGSSGTATIHYRYDSYTSDDVDPAPAQEGDVPVGFAGSKVQIGSRVYDVVPITC
jgi:hypothetical protein